MKTAARATSTSALTRALSSSCGPIGGLFRIAPADPDVAYPILIDAVGRCPPEDVGGPPGYEEFLEAIADPEHERHAEMHEWLGVSFDPQYVDPSEISQALQQTARRWRRKTTPRSTRP